MKSSLKTRRSFLKNSLLAAPLLLGLKDNLFASSNNISPQEKIKPAALKKGDRIGIIAPASNIDEPEDVNIARDMMEWLGFKPVIGKNVLKQYGYLAGKDEERADDLNEMFKRDDIDGIFCIRGGYGTLRMLPYIDYEIIKKNPKVLIGYSDITSLLLAIYKKTGLITFHGPVALSTFNDYTMEYLNKAIFTPKPIGEVKMPRKSNPVETENRVIKIGKGKASGELVGGNLTVFNSMIGTPYDIDTKGKILFLEDIGEEPYRIDRMLTQLCLTGKLKEAGGVIIGKLTDVKPSEYKPAFINNLSIEEILRTRFEPLNIPVMYGYMIGHIKDKVTVPIGAMATINVENSVFSIDESAVV
jgi:muramoyltetrapeptide carboxypeptidase